MLNGLQGAIVVLIPRFLGNFLGSLTLLHVVAHIASMQPILLVAMKDVVAYMAYCEH